MNANQYRYLFHSYSDTNAEYLSLTEMFTTKAVKQLHRKIQYSIHLSKHLYSKLQWRYNMVAWI